MARVQLVTRTLKGTRAPLRYALVPLNKLWWRCCIRTIIYYFGINLRKKFLFHYYYFFKNNFQNYQQQTFNHYIIVASFNPIRAERWEQCLNSNSINLYGSSMYTQSMKPAELYYVNSSVNSVVKNKLNF